ncbi:hypothetical protein, partial [Enterococcus casseliflavus]|uniref:hypothetical protein n=1 Tax=Enterococcus casseliflavus TaxID=37734 RepID=UPI003D0CE851
ILELERAKKLSSVARVSLCALEDLPTVAKFTELVPRVTGSTTTQRGVTPIHTDINVGTTVQATFHFDENGAALVQIFVERSRL